MATRLHSSRVEGRTTRGALASRIAAACLLWAGASTLSSAQTLEANLVPADPAATQLFGQSVALDGDVAVVGAAGAASNTGAAYVFRRTLSVWAQELKLQPGDLTTSDLFGASVALNGDLLAVGAPDALDLFGGSPRGPGAVYVFRDTGGTWPQQEKLLAGDGSNFDQLGASVAVQGDLLVAGAPGDQPSGDGAPNGGAGAAYVFRFDGLAWTQEAKLVATPTVNGDRLGASVALDGDVIAVGRPGYDSGSTDRGAVLVFRYAAGLWSFEAQLTAGDPANGDSFGSSVTVDGNLIAVGAPKDNQGFSDTGAVYVFRFNGSSWVQEAKQVAIDAIAQGQLGASVSLQGSMLLAGAPGALSGDGQGYLFADTGSGWIQYSQLAQPGSRFNGQGAALDDGTALLGSPWTTNGSLLFAGDAYVFDAFEDCNANGLADDVDISTGGSLDCNGNDVPDACDIAGGFSLDCNENGVPDECEPDCNGNDIPDDCDIAGGFSEDCDENGVPDECDPDLNRNGIPDACEGVWTDVGHALAGVSGDPLLEGEGTMIVGESVTITLSNARPNSQTAIFVGLAAINLPFKGGVFVPAPTLAIFGLPTGPAGLLPLTAHWPPGLPPSFTLHFQHWIVDPAAVAGFSASNGLSATTPP